MSAQQNAVRILVVANRTASTPHLLEEVRRRAREGAGFTLVIPPQKSSAGADDWSSADALELLERAAGAPVTQLDAGSDALAAVREAVEAGSCDEIILSTPPEHLSHWVHHDLRHRLEHLGMPVLVIPPEPDAPLPDHLRDGLPNGWTNRPIVPGADGAFEI